MIVFICLQNRFSLFGQQKEIMDTGHKKSKKTFQASIPMDYSDDSCNNSLHFGAGEEQYESEYGINDPETETNQMLNKTQVQNSPQIDHQKMTKRLDNNNITTKLTQSNSNKKFPVKCGCGKQYSNFITLYLHIQSIHGGVPPENTSMETKQMNQLPFSQANQPHRSHKFKDHNRFSEKFQSHNNSSQSQTEYRKASQEYPAYQQPLKSQDDDEDDKKVSICKICGKEYSCNSAVNLHIKKKHPQLYPLRKKFNPRTIRQNTIQNDLNAQNRPICQACGKDYSCNSALNLHIKRAHPQSIQLLKKNPPHVINQHNSQSSEGLGAKTSEGSAPDHREFLQEKNQQKVYDQKCGCGLGYRSPEALNRHINLKHGGIRPQGSTPKRDLRKQFPIAYFRPNQQQVIRNPQISRPYKCGCGNSYTVPSSLNLHIKKAHNWIILPGTIGGPRGIIGSRKECEDLENDEITHKDQADNIICQECGQPSQKSYYKCKSCPNHILCSICFWATNNFSKEHAWICNQKQ